MADDDLHVLHVGPDTTTGGGMATVIALLCQSPENGIRASSVATWRPNSRSRGMVATIGLICRLAGRRERPDWIHAHLSEGGSFVREGAVLLAARALGIGTAATLHGATFLDFSQRHPRLVRRVLAACRVVFALGPRAAARVAALSPTTTVRTVLNPVDLHQLTEAPTSARAGAVVFGGVVGRRKGIDRLVAAWPSVRSQRPDATCLVCGPLDDFPVEDLPEGMAYLGSLPRAELQATLKAAEVACLPSRDEALPMFVLESLALGVPVVTTPVGEIGQLGEGQGVVLTDGDPADLAGRLTELLTEPERRRLFGKRAAEWARDHCSVESVSQVLAASYRAS